MFAGAVAAVLFRSSRSWTAAIDGSVLYHREGLCPVPRAAPRLTLMGPSRPSDIAGDGPSPGGSDQDKVAAGDLRRLTPGDPLPRAGELGAGSTAGPPTLGVTEARKRSTRPPSEHTPDARPRVRVKTEGSTAQSDRGKGVSGGNGTMSGGQSSGASSRGSVTTRSGSVPISRGISVGKPIVKRRERKAPCGLGKCGSTAEWAMPQGAACVDCGVAHTDNEFLCAACHRTGHGGNRWNHLGPDLLAQAIAWVEECRAVGEGLPTCVVGSFVPSAACLCSSGDCFYAAFITYRRADENICVPCGSTNTVYWRSGGERAEHYQLFFEGAGSNRTEGGMLKTKEVITAESSICNPCHMAYYQYVTSRERLPTAKELLTASVGPQLPQGSARAKSAIKRQVYEALAAGKVVCSEDIEARLATEWRANNIEDASAGHVRGIAQKMLQEVGEGVGDTCVREYRDGAFGEDRRKTFVYLIPTVGRDDIMVRLDREIRKMDRQNEGLRQQLQKARCASVVREDVLRAPDLQNVRRGSTLKDDNTRQLVPAMGNLQQGHLSSVRELLAAGADTIFKDAHGRAPGKDFHETVATPLKVAVSSASSDELSELKRRVKKLEEAVVTLEEERIAATATLPTPVPPAALVAPALPTTLVAPTAAPVMAVAAAPPTKGPAASR